MMRPYGLLLVCLATISGSVLAGTATGHRPRSGRHPPARATAGEVSDVRRLRQPREDDLADAHLFALERHPRHEGAVARKPALGQVAFRSLAHRDVDVRFVRPDVAILNALSDVEVSVGGQPQKMTLRVTIVYVQKDGEWLFEAWHSSRRPE